MNVLRQVLGVDVAQKELVVTLGRLTEDLSPDLYLRRKFANRETGFLALLKWLKKNTVETSPLRVVLEATGVYHQKFFITLMIKILNSRLFYPTRSVITCVLYL